MPVVPKYDGPKVDLAPLPGVRQTAAETPASLGAGVAQSEAQLDEAKAGLGAEGFSILSKMQAAARDQADEVARLKWQNQLADFTKKALYDPEAGALSIKGEAAQALPEQIGSAYTKVADGIAAGLSNTRQKLQFAKDRQERQQSNDLIVLRHVDEQIQSWHAAELQGAVDNGLSLAIAHAQDPASAGAELASTARALVAGGPKLFGWGPEATKQHVDDLYSRAHVGIIGNLLDNKKVDAARLYFAEVKDQIKGEALGKIEQALQTAGTSKAGLDTSLAIWQQLGPKDDQAPINLDAMEAAAVEKFKGEADTAKFDETVKYLREKTAAVNAARKDRTEETAGAVWIAANKGASLDQVAAMPQFRQLDGKVQAQVNDYIVNKAEQLVSRDAAAESRAYTAESRIYTEGLRQDAEKMRAGWGAYWDLASNPAALDKTSVNALQALRGTLGDEHVNRLLTQKLTLAKGDEQVRAATMDVDSFNTIAVKAGLDPYSTQHDNKPALGQLHNAVEQEIDRAQQIKGKLLTRPEKEQLMQSVVDRKVIVDSWFGLIHTPTVAATVTTADRASAYVPIAQIPAADLTMAVNYLRSTIGTYAALNKSDADLVAAHRAELQHAYALRLMGAPIAEIQAALKGQ